MSTLFHPSPLFIMVTFNTTNLYLEIRHGISDMHCRSDGYLAEELQMEVARTQTKKETP